MMAIRTILIFPNELIRVGIISTISSIPSINVINSVERLDDVANSCCEAELVILHPVDKDELSIVREKFKAKYILVLDIEPTSERVKSLCDIDPEGYLLDCCPATELKEGIENIIKGGSHYCGTIRKLLLESEIESETKSLVKVDLTASEKEIVELLFKGETTKTIAEKTCRSHHTINTHRKNILKKLGVKNVGELLKFAVEKKLV